MKKILFGLLVLISVNVFGQNPTNYQYRFVRERSVAAMVDSGFHVPRYNGTPTGVRSGVSTHAGALAADTLNNRVYYWSDYVWHRLAMYADIAAGAVNIYNTSGILTANRTLTGSDNTYGLNFDSLNYFKVRRNNVLRLDISNSISKLASIAGDAYAYATTGEAGLWNDNSNIVVHNDDSIILNNTEGIYQLRNVHYNSGSDMVSLVMDTTNGRLYRKTITGGGSGTINSGTTGKPAYYVGATTLDDFAAVDYATSGDLVKITHQNTTDNGVLFQGIGSQTGNFITAKNSGATTVFELTEDGYGFFPAGTAANSSLKVGTNGFFDVSGVGLGIYSASLYRTYIGQFGLAYRDADVATIDFGNIGLFSTTNRIRISTPAEGTVTFHSTGLTAATIIKGTGGEGTTSSLYLEADEADDATDVGKITQELNGDLTFTNNATENLRIIMAGGLRMPEIAAPSTPASATAVIYPKSDGLWYGKDDAGVETALSNVAGSTPTLQQVLDAGSTLGSNETITVGANTLDISGTGEAFKVNTTTVGNAFQVTNSGAGGGIFSVTQAGKHYTGQSTYTSTNAVEEVHRSNRYSSGTAANGIGQTWLMNLENSAGSMVFANGIFSKFKNVTASSETSQGGLTGKVNGVSDTLMALGDYVTLTESSATKFTSTTLGTGSIQGGTIIITVHADDATDYQSRTLRFIWSAVNKANTLTITISTPEEVVAVSSGTLTATITAVDATAGVLDFKVNAVSSLTQSTLRATYQTFKNF
jgi:hypothetical protein